MLERFFKAMMSETMEVRETRRDPATSIEDSGGD
jgi:hypothetical protein